MTTAIPSRRLLTAATLVAVAVAASAPVVAAPASGPPAGGSSGTAPATRRADRGRLVDRIVAVVNDEVITLGELDRAVALRRAHTLPGLSPPCGTDEVADDSTDARRRTLECIIDSALVFQHVRRFPQTSHSPEQVDEALRRLIERFESRAAFEEELRRWSLSVGDVRRDLERQLMVQRYIDTRFRGFAEVSELEVREYYESELVPVLEESDAEVPSLEQVSEPIRRILRQRQINRRIDSWVEDLKRRARITRYSW